jgi:hypothetical protein
MQHFRFFSPTLGVTFSYPVLPGFASLKASPNAANDLDAKESSRINTSSALDVTEDDGMSITGHTPVSEFCTMECDSAALH